MVQNSYFLKKSSTQHLYYRIYLEILTFCKIHWLKGRLLGPRQDDLTIFKCFRVIFFLKKKTIKFPLSFNLYFQQKRAPNLSICHLQRNTLLGFLTPTNRRNGFANFQSCHQVVTYLFISLTKSWRYFENTLKPLTELIITYYKYSLIRNVTSGTVYFKSSMFFKKTTFAVSKFIYF